LGYDKPGLWKFRYYEYYYGVSIHQKNHIHNMCNNYLKGIVWTMKYYFQTCESFDWQYEYYNAPFVSDLSQYLKDTKCDIGTLKFNEKSHVITPFAQLLSVLPPSCHMLLPTECGMLMYHDHSPIIDLYPINVKIDMLYKDSFHKCIPLIPNINIEKIIDAIKDINFTSDEKQRNVIIENLIINHKK
jgi:5'-3' exonuclease